jgi:uncharacterized damage-inducible protein DinB
MIRTLLLALLLFVGAIAQTQNKPASLKAILVEQLRTTHNQKDWFVPVMGAIEGLTPEQAAWKDSAGDHSAGQLANHLLFWNAQQLAKLKGEKPTPFDGNNDETFNKFDARTWKQTVQRLDQVLSELEKLVESADDEKLNRWASTVAHIGTHNAYHTGQIISVRKLQGSWDASKGVK